MAMSSAVLIMMLTLHQLYFMTLLMSWISFHNMLLSAAVIHYRARCQRIRSISNSRTPLTAGWSVHEVAVMYGLESLAPPSKRRMWMKNRSSDWWDNIVCSNFDDGEWKENFRMSRVNFCELVAALAPFMSPECNYVREPVPVDKRIAIALYKLASCCVYRVVANQFGIHKSTVLKFLYLFCITEVL
ncbi:uncharacterized protein LOC144127727 [Amblyomma americanum]